MSLINCEINLHINWSENCIILATNVAAQVITFSTTDTIFYVLVLTLSTQDNAKLLEQLKSSFKKQLTGTNINQKYQQKE